MFQPCIFSSSGLCTEVNVLAYHWLLCKEIEISYFFYAVCVSYYMLLVKKYTFHCGYLNCVLWNWASNKHTKYT